LRGRAPSAASSRSQQPSQTWISTSGNTLSAVSVTTTNNAFTYIFSGGTSLSSGAATYEAFAQPSAAFSDAFVQSTQFANATNFTSFPNGGTIPNGVVGIIPFAWVKGPQGAGVTAAQYNRLTNITTDQASELLLSGAIPLAMLTGNAADAGVDVVLSGRNNDSGTRFSEMAEAGLPESTSITQYGFTTSGSFINAFGFATPIAGSSPADYGNPYNSVDGQSSGGNLAAWVEFPPNANSQSFGFVGSGGPGTLTNGAGEPNGVPFIVVAYLGVSDAKTVATGNGSGTSGATLSFNGVPANILLNGSLDIFNGNTNTLGGAVSSAAPEGTLIQNGQYDSWEYEHFYFLKTLSGASLDAVNSLHTQVFNTDALAAGMFATPASGMLVGRSSEFVPPFPFTP
jgi:hypothetical protein